MTAFDARLRLIGQTAFPLVVAVDLTDERMIVTAGESEVADWELREISISALSDGFHIMAEEEEVILNVAERSRFAVELGVADSQSGRY